MKKEKNTRIEFAPLFENSAMNYSGVNESFFRLLYDESPLGMVMVDSGNRFMGVNKTFCKMLGYSFKEFQQLSISDISHPVNFSAETENIQKLKRGEIPFYKTEKIYIRKDKKEFWGALTASANFNEKGELICLVALIEDINERKLAHQELANMAEQWQKIFDGLNDAICLVDTDNRILEANKGLKSLLPDTDLIGKKCWKVFHNSDEPPQSCPMTRMKISHRRESAELSFNGKWYDLTVDPLFDSKGELVSAVHTMRDITERRLVAKALRNSEEKFRKAFNSNPSMVLISTLEDGIILDANRQFIEMMGWERSQLVGHTAKELEIYADYSQRTRMVERLLLEGTVKDMVIEVITRAGELRVCLASAVIIEMDNQKRMFLQINDITEREQAKKMLEQSESKYHGLIDKMTIAFGLHEMIFDENGKPYRTSGGEMVCL